MALGFEHPNMLAAQIISIILLFLCVKRYNLKKRYLFCSFILCCIVFFISKSRTALILSLFSIVLVIFSNWRVEQKIIERILPNIYLLVILVVGVSMTMYYQLGRANEIVKFINDSLFNGRIGLAYMSLITYPTTLFGKKIDTSIWNQWQYFALDNGQVMVWLEYGIIGFLAYFFIIQKALKQIKKEKEYILAIILITFLIWSMFEGTMYFLGKNFTLLFLGTTTNNVLVRQKNQTKREEKYDT